jgi:hypothetical protein
MLDVRENVGILWALAPDDADEARHLRMHRASQTMILNRWETRLVDVGDIPARACEVEA